MKIVFVPIDNRPVCYQLPEMIASIDKSIDLLLPPIDMLGDLTKCAKVKDLLRWLKLSVEDADKIILSLDTVAYGGLIPSRRSSASYEEIKSVTDELKVILQSTNAEIYAFSSVMRISNNNINEEEKEYWSEYGEKIFQYSFETDKYGKSDVQIPQKILEDYLSTRKRNFKVNKNYLDWQKEGLFKTLIFSKDDCAEFGFNVKEAKELAALGGFTKTGADEIPLTLLAKAIPVSPAVCPIFIEDDCINLISNYEDISIENSVKGQLELSGCEITDKNSADVLLYVNNFRKTQGEIVMKRETELFDKTWLQPEKMYCAADVRNANGADNKFVDCLLNTGLNEDFLGYSAWNTSANTLGSLICAMKVVLYAKQTGNFDIDSFKNLQIIRFLDDWAYQANIRQKLNSPDIKAMSAYMLPYEERIKKVFKADFCVNYSFPWNRLFEVKIELN